MNKIIKIGIGVFVANCKFCFLKILNPERFTCHFSSVISPLTEITLNNGGSLRMGKRFKMHSCSKIKVRNSAILTLGDNFFMNNNCSIVAHSSIKIGNNVMLGPNVCIYDHDHDYRIKEGISALKFQIGSIEIGNNVWIGANTIILRNSVIGDNCVIAAGSIVKGSVPDNTLFVQDKNNRYIEINNSITRK